MPTVNKILEGGKKKAYRTELTNDEVIDLANEAYQDMIMEINTNVGGAYFYQIFNQDIQAGFYEYQLPDTIDGETLIDIVTVDTQNSVGGWTRLVKDEERARRVALEDTLDSSAAFYDIVDNSLMLYPNPKEDVAAGLMIQCTVMPADLVVDGAETTVFPRHPELRYAHTVLQYGLAYKIFEDAGQDDKAQVAKAKYDQMMFTLFGQINNRTKGWTEITLPATK